MTGSPIGKHSGKAATKRGSTKAVATNVDEIKVRIPLDDRARYVAYLKLNNAIQELNFVYKNLENCTTDVDRVALKKAIDDVYKLVDQPYIALGMDREFNLILGDRMPERTTKLE